MKIIGVDPGVRGGLALVAVDANGAAPQLVDAIDVPVTGTGAKERVNTLAIRSWIAQHTPQHAAVGAIEAVIACCEIPLTIVEPSIWKKFHQLRGGDKEAGRQRALQLFPAAHALVARCKDHGRAESALLAPYGSKVLLRSVS